MIDADEPAATTPEVGTTNPDPRPDGRSARLAAWVFGAYVAAGLPVLILGIGKFWWFFRDDWFFVTDRDLSMDGLFEDHNGHWVTAPVLVFRFLWEVVGLHSYAPYKATVVIAHLVVVVCVRAIMRRYGVGPWLATVMAGSLVLFGSGREDILWAFQVGFTGSIALLLAQWWLADREDAPLDRRDALGAACGVVAVTAGSPALPLIAALAATLLVRRGWRAAVVHAAPATAAYLVWSLIIQPDRSSPFGAPPVSALIDWVNNGVVSTFDDLTGTRWAAVVLGLAVVAGTVLSLVRPTGPRPAAAEPETTSPLVMRIVVDLQQRLRPVIGPIALFGATVVFILLASQRAWIFGPDAASASRYIYAYAAFSLPLMAMSIQELANRWRLAAPLLALLVVIGVPSNIDRFRDPIFGPDHHAHQRDLFMNVVRSPALAHAPADLRPDPDAYNSPGLTVGFFRRAEADGKLPQIDSPIPSAIEAELTIRLGLVQGIGDWVRAPCAVTEATRFQPESGSTFYLDEPIDVRVRDHEGPQRSTRLQTVNGHLVTVIAPDLDLDLAAVQGGPATICVVE